MLDHGRQHVTGGTSGHIVKDLWDVHRIGNSLEVQIKAVLGGFVVVGGDQQAGIHACFLGHVRQVNGLAGGVGTGAGDDRQATGSQLHHTANDVAMLLRVQGRGFAGCAHRDDGVGAAIHVELHQAGERRVVYLTVAVHGRYHGHDAALKHPLLRVLRSIYYATSPGSAWQYSPPGLGPRAGERSRIPPRSALY